jgi:hypothetical protein
MRQPVGGSGNPKCCPFDGMGQLLRETSQVGLLFYDTDSTLVSQAEPQSYPRCPAMKGVC